jgi:WD40 repeat protein
MHAGDFLLGVAGLQAGLIRPDDFAAVVRGWESGDEDTTFGQLLALSCHENAVQTLRVQAERLATVAEQDLPGASAELRGVMRALGLNSSDAITLQPEGGFLDVPANETGVAEEIPGRYQFSLEHAQGGMGKVLIVYDSHLARRIALKELLPLAPVSSSASTLEVRGPAPGLLARQRQARFLYEARITGQLEHPSIVPIYELGRRSDGSLYYTMRLIKGRSLRQAIRLAGSLEGRLRLLSHFTDLCQAIAFAHSRGVIHRDIKPGNVMVGEFGETVVIDWGLARMRQSTADLSENGGAREDIDLMKEAEADVVAVGTPAYMPPEQARGDMNAIDERSDVYSLGAVLYELLSGVAPYSDPSSASALNKLLSAPPAPVTELVTGVPEELAAICSHAMARDPRDRYQSARELAADIEHFLAGRLVGVYRYKPMELLSYFVRRFKAPLLVGAVSLLGLLLTGTVAYLQVQSERNKAVQESIRAQEAEQLAETARLNGEQEFYLAAISSGRRFISDGQFQRAMAQLEKCSERFRHWEWGHLVYLCNRDQRTFRAHSPETAWSIDITKNGRYAITGGFDKTAKGWEMASGKAYFTYESPNGAIIEVSGHPTLPVAVFAEEGGSLTLYDMDTKKVLSTWRATDEGDVNCVQFSPDGRTFASSDEHGRIRLWDFDSLQERWSIAPVEGGIETLDFSPDGALLATSDRSKSISLWNAADGSLRKSLAGHASRVTSMDFSPDGKYLASGGRDRNIFVWDLDTGTPARQIQSVKSTIWCVAYSPDGRYLASGNSDRDLDLWNTADWTLNRTYQGHLRQIYCLSFSPDGNALLSGDDEGIVKQWDIRNPNTVDEHWTLRGHTGMINHASYSPDGALLATAAGDWKTNDDTTARLWESETGNLIGVLQGHTASVRHTEFHPDGKVMATSSHDGTVRIWNTDTRELLRVLGPFDVRVNVSEFNPHAPSELLIGLYNGELMLMNWTNGETIARWQEHEGEVLGLSYHPKGEWFVSASADDTAHVIRTETRERVKVLEHAEANIPSAVFSPDGRWLATGGHDWRVKLWNTGTWEQVHELQGHTQGVYSVSFSDDGRRLLSTGTDSISILWDLATFREVLQIQGRIGAMRPGSADIVTATTTGEAFIWPAFPWKTDAYPGAPDLPLNVRAEATKREFWESRLSASGDAAPEHRP